MVIAINKQKSKKTLNYTQNKQNHKKTQPKTNKNNQTKYTTTIHTNDQEPQYHNNTVKNLHNKAKTDKNDDKD